VLAERVGQPFQEVSSESEEAGLIAAALHTYLRGRARSGQTREPGAAPSGWKRAARLDALRAG
jgi:hypothetical protein